MANSWRFLALCTLFALVSCEVIDISQEDFEDVVEGDKITLVEFYAPWCQHCQELEPVYEKASEKLSKQAQFARVDGTKETKLMGRFGIKGYPSILTFSSGIEIGAFGGDRTLEGFEEYLSRFNTPATVQITSPGKASDFMSSSKQAKTKASLVGLFRTKECEEYRQYSLLAQMMRKEIQFGETFADDVFKKFGIADSVKAAVVVSKLGDTAGYSTYAGEFSAKLLMTWAKAQSLPPVPMIDENNAQDLVEIGLPFFVIFVESDVADMVSDATEMLMSVREKYEGKFTFLTADGFQLKDQVQALGLSVHELPQVAIDEVQHDRIYPFKEEITVDNLMEFAGQFVSGKLKPLKVPDGAETPPAPAAQPPSAAKEVKETPKPPPITNKKKEEKKEKTLEEEFPEDDDEDDEEKDEEDRRRWAHEDAKKRKEAKEKARKLVVEDPNAKITKLNKASFDKLTDEPFVLVYFYTEKCVFCKDLLPIIESVANKGPHKIAKVDGEKEKEIIYQVNVTAYPTLWVLRNGQPDARPYSGARQEAAISEFLARTAAPVMSDVSDDSKIAALAKSVPSVVVGTFSDAASDAAKEFEELAEDYRGEYSFGVAIDATAKAASVVLHRHDISFVADERLIKYDGAFSASSMAKWVESESVPLVDELSADTVQRYVQRGRPFCTMFFDSNKPGARENATKLLMPLGQQFRGSFSFLVIDARELADQLESYGLQYGTLPRMVIDRLDGDGFYKYRGELEEKPMVQFVSDVVGDKIKAHRKSQDFDKPREGLPVYPMSFIEWDELVTKRDKAIIIEFWAPWCGFCKNFVPTYTAVGKKVMALGLNGTIRVASMDMTQNHLPDGIKLDGYPTVLLFPKSRRAAPESYDGDFTGKDVVAFIRDNLTTKKSKRKKPRVMSGVVGESVSFDQNDAAAKNKEEL